MTYLSWRSGSKSRRGRRREANRPAIACGQRRIPYRRKRRGSGIGAPTLASRESEKPQRSRASIRRQEPVTNSTSPALEESSSRFADLRYVFCGFEVILMPTTPARLRPRHRSAGNRGLESGRSIVCDQGPSGAGSSLANRARGPDFRRRCSPVHRWNRK